MSDLKKGKSSKLKQGAMAAAFLVPTALTASAVALTVGAYEPLVFDPTSITQTARAEAQELQTAEAKSEKTSAEPTTDAEYSASDYGMDAGDLKDGTYRGSAYGFKSTITVDVTIKGGKITNIEIVSENDDASYFNRAKAVINSVLKKQSTSVDTVSGATYSSKGILMAIKNALTKAAGGTVDESASGKPASTKASSKKNKPATVAKVPEGKMKDGTYVGKGMGYNDYIRIAVTVKDDKIVDIKIVSQKDDEPYFTNASVIIENVLKKQSTDVDTVSGATYSSKGILAAIADALSQAVKADKQGSSSGSASGGGSDDGDGKDDADSGSSDSGKDSPDSGKGDSGESGEVHYKDGTYSGTALCRNGHHFSAYYVEVAIVVKDGKVSKIESIKGVGGGSYVYDEGQNGTYLDNAINGCRVHKPSSGSVLYRGVQAQLEEGVSPSDIDLVATATYSSKSIVTAYKAALEKSAAAYKADPDPKVDEGGSDKGTSSEGGSGKSETDEDESSSSSGENKGDSGSAGESSTLKDASSAADTSKDESSAAAASEDVNADA